MDRLNDHKWLDPECGEKGCRSLVWKTRYDAAVKGRAEFRQLYMDLRALVASNPVPDLRDALKQAREAFVVAGSMALSDADLIALIDAAIEKAEGWS